MTVFLMAYPALAITIDFGFWRFSRQLTMADLRPGLKQADIKLSSAGLVYHNFGEEIIASQMKIDSDDPAVKKVWRKVYENFIREVDAIDNGIEMCEGEPK